MAHRRLRTSKQWKQIAAMWKKIPCIEYTLSSKKMKENGNEQFLNNLSVIIA